MYIQQNETASGGLVLLEVMVEGVLL